MDDVEWIIGEAFESAGEAALLEVAFENFAFGLLQEHVCGVVIGEDVEDERAAGLQLAA